MDLAWIVLLVFFGGLVLLFNTGAIAEWFFRTLQLPGMLRRRGWEDRTEPPELNGSELKYLAKVKGEPVWQESLHIGGTHRGYEFSAFQRYGYDTLQASTGRLHVIHRAVVEVSATGMPGRRDISVNLLTGRITVGWGTLRLPAEFEQWLRRNRFRCHRFSTGNGFVTTRLGSRIRRGRLLRKLNYLVDVVERWPGTTPRKRSRGARRRNR